MHPQDVFNGPTLGIFWIKLQKIVLFSTSFNLDVKSFWPDNHKINSYWVVLCTVPPGNQEWLTRQIPTFLNINSSLVGHSSLLLHVRYVSELHQRSWKTFREHAVTLTADVCLYLCGLETERQKIRLDRVFPRHRHRKCDSAPLTLMWMSCRCMQMAS